MAQNTNKLKMAYLKIQEIERAVTALKPKFDSNVIGALKNTPMVQWPFIIEMIEETEEFELKLKAEAKQIDAMKAIRRQYALILEKQRKIVADLEAKLNQ